MRSTIRGVRAWWAGIPGALAFLTILPVPAGIAKRGLSRASAFFPLVGLLTGAAILVGREALGGGPLGATVGLVLAAVLTGGLHEDAWADTADAVGAPGGTERRREILHDPRVGAHALWSSVLLILVRVFAVAGGSARALLAGAVLGRLAMVLTLHFAPVVAGSRVGRSLRLHARPLVATVVAGASLLLLVPGGLQRAPGDAIGDGLLIAGGSAIAGVVFAGLVLARLGGFGGDAHGATGLVVETAVWVLAVAVPT